MENRINTYLPPNFNESEHFAIFTSSFFLVRNSDKESDLWLLSALLGRHLGGKGNSIESELLVSGSHKNLRNLRVL